MLESLPLEVRDVQQQVQQDALLAQLKRRFPSMIDNVDKRVSIDLHQAFELLITRLYRAQLVGQAVVIADYEHEADIRVDQLRESFAALISAADEDRPTPIIYFDQFICFRRYYQQLSDSVAYLQMKRPMSPISADSFRQIDWRLSGGEDLTTEQRLAAIGIATQPFCLVTGGAGTGKTTTLSKGLELLLVNNPAAHVVLAAPTGKAAHRLNEALAGQIAGAHSTVKELIASLRATTLHRLLGISAKSGRPYFTARNPLRCDVLVIDEASMIGSDLFVLIQAALLPSARLVLLGDANQLPAINSAAFFNEISQLPIGYTVDFCDLVNPLLGSKLAAVNSPLPNAIYPLSASHRFAQQSIVELVSAAILASDMDAVTAALGPRLLPLSVLSSEQDYRQHLLGRYPNSREALLSALSRRVILCANRQGPFGSRALNDYLDSRFRRLLNSGPSQPREDSWYEGRRIMIERNDYMLGLYNGDIGCCQLIDEQWQIVFEGNRLVHTDDVTPDDYSLAFALSIHKSQGSEYDEVAIVLDTFDPDAPNPLVTDKLLYTAVTRAKKEIVIYSDTALIAQALQNRQAQLMPLSQLL
ncbi:MAG: exodeoxyribonuclease V subunit alpha [Gammaproteobacteria bacterium]|nr:MAG: exodeoxyribonuclease V subunit alpha [Gammaproteobacteria bacterium]